MQRTSVLELTGLDEAAPAPLGEGCALSVAVVYQDGSTKRWARQLCDRVTKIVGQDCVRITWWNISDLSEPGVLAGAVSTAMRADVIVVAIHAAKELPLPFYVWVEAWLPHRLQAMGSLLALIDMPDQADSQSDRARDYLRSIARLGRLDFLVEERKLPPEPAEAALESICDCRAPAPVLGRFAARGRSFSRPPSRP
jgi:hypothetical protein